MSQDWLMLFLVGGAVVVVIGGLALWRPERGPHRYLRELAVFLGAYVAYFGVRGLTEGDVMSAVEHARGLIRFEQALGIWFEPTLQATVLEFELLVTLANWVYIWGHWPVIIGVGVWLLARRPSAYGTYRNAFLISGALGLVLFALLPVAPPRLVGRGFVDTVTIGSEAYRVLQPPQFTNQFAAFPSLHMGWNLLIGLALLQTTRLWTTRMFAMLMPLAMLAAIVLTANHYLLDAAVGALLALVGLAAARWLAGRPLASRPHAAPSS